MKWQDILTISVMILILMGIFFWFKYSIGLFVGIVFTIMVGLFFSFLLFVYILVKKGEFDKVLKKEK